MLNIKKILVPTDLSSHAEFGFHLACALARDYKAELVLLLVKPPTEAVVGEFGMTPPESTDEIEAIKEQFFAIKPDDNSINVDYHFREGDPVAVIINVAKELGCDLIIMGTHGRTGLKRLLMGSVAEKVVREAPCPVLAIKQPMSE